jgi:hypothetical protein
MPLHCVGLTLLSFACAGTGSGYLVEDAPRGVEIRTVLLVPMNFDATPPTELVHGVEILDRKVARYVEDSGRRVQRASLADVMHEWQKLAGEVGGFVDANGSVILDERVEWARGELARRLAADRACDVVLMPSLLVRPGWYSGIKLRWDGVTRIVPIDLEPGSFMETQSIAGQGLGTSLRMTGYTPGGDKFFERFAGLEPVDRFEMGGFGTTRGGYVRSSRRDDLFEDTEILDEGIAMGFASLIEPSRGATK